MRAPDPHQSVHVGNGLYWGHDGEQFYLVEKHWVCVDDRPPKLVDAGVLFMLGREPIPPGHYSILAGRPCVTFEADDEQLRALADSLEGQQG